MEENRPWWGVRTSNPGRTVKRLLVGSTPALFRHPSYARRVAKCETKFERSGDNNDGGATGLDPANDGCGLVARGSNLIEQGVCV
jgi:hypothetical protein